MAVLADKSLHAEGQLSHSQFLIQSVEARMRAVLREGSAPVGGQEPLSQRAALYHLASGGQRIRAQLALQAGVALYRALGGGWRTAAPALD